MFARENGSYRTLLVSILLIKFLLMLALIVYGGIGLSPDEAQYWTWSQEPAAGYYSKPPGIAYQILIGTSLFGSTELGVRFGSALLGILLPLTIYQLAKGSGLKEEASFWAALIWAFSPLGWIGSLLAITDGGMILFWTCSVIVYLKRGPGAFLGLMIALGALFKWPIYLLWLFIFADQIFLISSHKRNIKGLIIGFLVSLIGFAPTLFWNIDHDFATFRHVAATLQGGSGEKKAPGNFWEFFGTQVALLSPVFFGLMILSYKKRAKVNLFCYLLTLPLITIGLILAFFMKVQGNWAIVAYPTAAVLAASVGVDYKKWLYTGFVLSIAAVAAIFFFVPLKHNTGWNYISSALTQAGYHPEEHFLVSDKYQNTAILSFYSPGQKRAYFLNLKGDRLNQFSFWPSLKEKELHQNGFFVTFDGEEPELSPYFSEVQKLETFLLAKKKEATIYKVLNYNGLEPKTTNKY